MSAEDLFERAKKAPRRRQPRPMRRPVMLALVLAAGVASVVTTRHTTATREPQFGTAPAAVQALQPRATAISVSWMCPGVPATVESPGVIAVVNPLDLTATIDVTLMQSDGRPRRIRQDVPALSRIELELSKLAPAPFTAAVVESRWVELVVEQRAVVGGTVVSAPCMSATSDRWYSADGSTAKDASSSLLLMNPFPADAVVDLEFTTEEGQSAQRGVLVPGRSLRVVDLGEEGTRRKNNVAMTAKVIIGRVVAGRVTRFDGSADRVGVVAGPLSPALGTELLFADGSTTADASERYVVYNPGAERAEVQIVFYPDVPATTTNPIVIDPVATTVAPGETSTVDPARLALPAGPHRAVVTSLNGVGVVVERVISSSPSTGAPGVSSVFGSQVSAAKWWVGDAPLSGGGHARIVVANLTGTPGRVTISVLGPAGSRPLIGATDVEIVPSGSRTFDLERLTPGAARLAVLVEATVPVVVERVQRVDGVVGLARSLGLPAATVAGSAAIVEPLPQGTLPGDPVVTDPVVTDPTDAIGGTDATESGSDPAATTATVPVAVGT
jgi:hypothetical protein